MFDPTRSETPSSQEQILAETQPHVPAPRSTPRRGLRAPAVVLGLLLGLSTTFYLLFPVRTNVLLLGSDRRPAESTAARTDTMMLVTVLPLQPYVGMLSIPRDLWVEIPGVGPNRINAAFLLAEAQQAGRGGPAAVETVRANFGVDVDAYVSLDFTGLVRFVDGLGGVDIDLARPTGGYDVGIHHLDGTQALAFARDRAGSDDFFRMERSQDPAASLVPAGRASPCLAEDSFRGRLPAGSYRHGSPGVGVAALGLRAAAGRAGRHRRPGDRP